MRLAVAAGLVAGVSLTLAGCGASPPQRPAAGHAAVDAERARVLALGVLPNGQGFWISGRRYTLRGRPALDLTADLEPPVSQSSPGEAFGSAGAGTLSLSRVRGSIAFGELLASSPKPVTLLLGFLRVPSDAVTLRSDGRLRPMTRVPIPPELRAAGALVYGYADPSRASEVVVRSQEGAVLRRVWIPGGIKPPARARRSAARTGCRGRRTPARAGPVCSTGGRRR